MFEKVVVLSRRNIDKYPAMCCMAELENVIISEYGAELLLFPNVPQNIRNSVIFCVLLGFSQFSSVEKYLYHLKQQGNRVILYIFDCFNVALLLSARRRRLRDRLRPSLRLQETVDQMCLPFLDALESLKPEHRALARHVPLAVDNSLVNGSNTKRPIAFLAYGRQPPKLTRLLAETVNRPQSPDILHHTDHMCISEVHDLRLHRLHFWKLAQSSQIALAYDAKLTSPRWPFSIVGQRFFESLAAGCIIAGNRPTTSEADELLNWPDAVIDLPDEPGEAVQVLHELKSDVRRLSLTRERNLAEVRARHDWRHRIPAMLQS